MVETGKVWLVGAGPGDAGLLTLKGMEVLKKADVVIYDALAGDEVLSLVPPDTRQVYVGKRAGCHAMPQEDINRLILAEALDGKRVVRLKGGDPFVFGRGGEELSLLADRGIPFELVPGVTSAVAVAEYCGIPVTHRGLSSSFHVITGHGKQGERVEIDYPALVKLGGTLIFLMGLSALEEICESLKEAGMAGDIPAAVLESGTTAGQRKVIATLSTLAKDSGAAGIKAPAILVIGEVCGMEPVCRWAELRPLHGTKVLVTRPERVISKMTAKLRSLGAQVIECPSVCFRTPEESGPLNKALQRVETYQWLALTSPSGVELLFEYLEKIKLDVRSLSHLKIAVLGPGTREKLQLRAIYADYMPDSYYAADLGRGLARQMGQGERLLILRAREGSEELTRELDKRDVSYDDVALYETLYPSENPNVLRARAHLEEGTFSYVTFTSASTVEGFLQAIKPGEKEISSFTAVCIGRETEKKAREHGFHTITARIPSIDSVAEIMTEDWKRTKEEGKWI